MSTLAEPRGQQWKPWHWVAAAGVVLLIWAAVALPNLHRSRESADAANLPMQALESRVAPAPMPVTAGLVAQDAAKATIASYAPGNDAAAGRKIVRTISLDMVVQHPSEVAQQITAMAESLGGYLVSAQGGGQNAETASLTIRVPTVRFEQARAEIRKLGLRVESERVDAQDVSRQYVDQDATLRNLRAEEAGYLTILKQAGTVKDMLAVSEKLSEVRGQIEQQQAEFIALSQQIETVAITISLRSETDAQVLGLNWRPWYQVKMALRDGLESVANYATAMAAVLFYLPAVLLWAGTLFFGGLAGWRIVRWAGRRWFGWKVNEAGAQ